MQQLSYTGSKYFSTEELIRHRPIVIGRAVLTQCGCQAKRVYTVPSYPEMIGLRVITTRTYHDGSHPGWVHVDYLVGLGVD